MKLVSHCSAYKSNMSRCELNGAIEAIGIQSPTRYSWFKRLSPRLIPELTPLLTKEQARNYLLNALTWRLYSDFYLRGEARPSGPDVGAFGRIRRIPFVADLSAANSGKGPWEDGWSVQSVEHDTAVVFRNNLLLWANLLHCEPSTGNRVESGMTIRLHFPKELLGMSPGFYMALGDLPLERDGGTITRLYWNLRAEGAISFVKTGTELLNRGGIPFRLKVVGDNAHFTRCDAGVIYIFKSDYEAALDILRAIYAEVMGDLKPGNPALTKRLASGVGLAEDPGFGASFGMNRCRLLADGVIRAYEKGKKSPSARLEVVAERFAEEGISLNLPFMNPGSKDDYDLIDISSFRRASGISRPKYNRQRLLQAAEEIGWRLCQEAFWHCDQCTWLGTEPGSPDRDEDEPTKYKALGPTMYSGTTGIALFLGELYAAGGSDGFRRAALGALRQAIARAEAMPRKSHLALYTGAIGIAYGAVRTGVLLREQELLDAATRLLRKCVRVSEEPRDFDLLSGDAGGIIGLLTIRQMLPHCDAPLLELAVRLGDELLRTAERSDAGYSWRSNSFRSQRNLTGFSHGTAGVGYGLLELFCATGVAKYCAGARRAFDYERYWFIADEGNWPDFRAIDEGRRMRSAMTCSTFWCHGAPGIALSRLHAYEILGEDEFRDEAVTALRTTRSMVESALRTGTDNFLLCHGLAGNVEVLLHGLRVSGDTEPSASELARKVAIASIEAYKKAARAWSSPTANAESLSLLLGLAGLGYFYLRLHSPSIPSILMIRPANFSSK